jgi:hypothetical protein
MITSALVKGTFGAPGYLFLCETLVATVPSVKSPHLPGPATSSNFVGCSTGRSAGLAPLGILSMYLAARRNKPG